MKKFRINWAGFLSTIYFGSPLSKVGEDYKLHLYFFFEKQINYSATILGIFYNSRELYLCNRMPLGHVKPLDCWTLRHPITWLSQNSCRGSYSEIRTPASVNVIISFVLLHCCQTCRKMKVHNSSSKLGSQYSIILGIKRRDIKEYAFERDRSSLLLLLSFMLDCFTALYLLTNTNGNFYVQIKMYKRCWQKSSQLLILRVGLDQRLSFAYAFCFFFFFFSIFYTRVSGDKCNSEVLFSTIWPCFFWHFY